MNEQVLYEKKEIFIHEQPKEEVNGPLIEAEKIGGRLQILKNKVGTFIRFLPYGQDTAVSEDWAFIVDNSVLTYSKNKDEPDSVSLENKASNSVSNKYKLQFDVNELSSVRRVYPGYGIPSIIFMLADGHTWPALYFHKGGSKEFLQELKAYFVFTKNVKDPRLWSVQRPDGEQFKQSLYELSLFNEQRNDVVKKFLNEPIQSTLLSFSKITNIVRDVLKPSDVNPSISDSEFNASNNQPSKNAAGKKNNRNKKAEFNHEGDDMSELLDSMNSENIHISINDGFEMVTKVDLGPMPIVTRGPFVNQSTIQYDKEGKVIDPDNLKQLIFKGGVEPTIRIEVWKFLLNFYDWNSTFKARTEKRKTRVEDYYRMKLQWKSISEEQKQKFSVMKERESLIEKDVQRTDRSQEFFEGDDNQNLVMMKDILMTYNMFNFDLGYVQGMSDLLAPIMVIMENEVDSFWCFSGYMDKIESNFLMEQLEIKLQLSNLRILLEFIDSKFSQYLEKNESSNMYFCFRWILILFKREFSFPNIMRLWEVLWTDLPCKNFHLLICVSILLMKKDDIMTNGYGFNEILKFVNDLSGRIDLEKSLQFAEGLYIQLSTFKNLPAPICEMIGLPVHSTNLGAVKDELDIIDENLSKSSSSINDLKRF